MDSVSSLTNAKYDFLACALRLRESDTSSVNLCEINVQSAGYREQCN